MYSTGSHHCYFKSIVYGTSGVLIASIIIIIIVLSLLIASATSKMKLNGELYELQKRIDLTYEDMKVHTSVNTAYIPTFTVTFIQTA